MRKGFKTGVVHFIGITDASVGDPHTTQGFVNVAVFTSPQKAPYIVGLSKS